MRVQGERSLPIEVEQPIFRIVQEALANVARHSEAGLAEIVLLYSNGTVSLTVTDDGRGFYLDDRRTGYGLSSMQERAESLGGNLVVESTLGNGTTVSCSVPVNGLSENRREEANE